MTKRVEKLIATVFGIGYLPIAPGTWASAAAMLVWFLTERYFPFTVFLQCVLIILSIVAGLWSTIRLEKEWGKDPSQVVVDEWAGTWITCFMLPAGIGYMLLALFVFRVLDIWKPLFIRSAEKFKGGWGIMMDDLVAGICGNILIHLLLYFLARTGYSV